MKKITLSIVFLLIVSLLVTGCSTPKPATQIATEQPATEQPAKTAAPVKPLRIAAVLPGRVDDGTFNQLFYEGLMKAKKDLGDKIEISYVENKYQVVDIEPALQDYASQGYDLIFGHGFQFQDPIMKLAPQYPNVHFAIGAGAYMTADNVSTYDADNGEIGYALGTVAGLATKSNKLGTVLGLIVPNVAAMQNGYAVGAKAVNPNAKVTDIVIGSFDDAAAAREGANTLIGQGVDVIFSVMNNAAAMEATEAKGAYGILTNDLTTLYPKSMLASTPQDYSVSIEEMVADILANKFGNKAYTGTFNNGGLSLVYRSDLDPSVKAKIDAVLKEMKDGKIIVPTPVPAK